ncbi:hypothetical protein J2S30_005002 [Herbaspirillum rubrisubalbicans]|nr:hypothetical protein [Herbaspirillum rubrisubalbicans]
MARGLLRVQGGGAAQQGGGQGKGERGKLGQGGLLEVFIVIGLCRAPILAGKRNLGWDPPFPMPPAHPWLQPMLLTRFSPPVTSSTVPVT